MVFSHLRFRNVVFIYGKGSVNDVAEQVSTKKQNFFMVESCLDFSCLVVYELSETQPPCVT